MDPRHLVQVFAHTGGGGGWNSTGYPVAPGRVLTAKHALQGEGATGEIEVRWYNLEGPAREWRPAMVEWEGRDGVDAAILACEFPAEFTVAPYTVAAAAPWESFQWTSAGFAAAGAKGDEIPPTPLTGRVLPVVEDLHRVGTFHLGVDFPPGQAEDWQGASGSPVFVDQRIVGVIASAQRPFQGCRLSAVSTLRLLDDPEFRARIGYADRWKSHERYPAQLSAALAKSRPAAECLAFEVGMDTREAWRGTDVLARQVVDRLLLRRLQDLLPSLSNARRELFEAHDPESAQVVQTVAALLIPAVSEAAHVQVGEWLASGHGLLTLPAATETVAEIVLAASEARAVRFKPPSGELPEPELRIPPCFGGETEGIAGFARAFESAVIRQFVVDPRIRARASHEELAQTASAQLRRVARYNKEHHYYVIEVARRDELAEWNAVVAQLRSRYPDVIFVTLLGVDFLDADEVRFHIVDLLKPRKR